jgi:hypothetical protein
LGIADGNLIQVRAQLEPGQLVVVQGNERLRPGQDVQIQRLESADGTNLSQRHTSAQAQP